MFLFAGYYFLELSLLLTKCLTQVDAELHRELEQWNEMLRMDVVKLCQENNFNTGFFEGTDNSSAIDAYELKVISYFSLSISIQSGNL